jgi:hypothetical protein
MLFQLLDELHCLFILETAVEVLPGEPASSTASVCRKGSCHQLGELRSSWKSIPVSHLQTALGVNCRFSDYAKLGRKGRIIGTPVGRFGTTVPLHLVVAE